MFLFRVFLGVIELCIDAALFQKFCVGTAFGDHTVCNRDDPVGRADGGQPVGDDQGGSALGEGIEGSLDLGLGDRVQSGGGLVQDQNGGILQKDPGNGNTLFFLGDRTTHPVYLVTLILQITHWVLLLIKATPKLYSPSSLLNPAGCNPPDSPSRSNPRFFSSFMKWKLCYKTCRL